MYPLNAVTRSMAAKATDGGMRWYIEKAAHSER